MAKIVSRGDPIEPVYLNNLKVAAHGWGIISGLAVSERGAGVNMSVDIAAGVAWISGEEVTKGSTTNVAITAAHASYDRYDLVVINSSGTISVIAGTAAATSYANDYDLETNNAILLAEVYVPATDTTIENAQITDKIILLELLPSLVFPCVEEYSNHLGATDNFTQTGTTGNGTATADTTNHEMDLSTGVTVVGTAKFETKKTFTLDSIKPIVLNFIVQGIQIGVGGQKASFFGLMADFADPTSQRITFDSNNAGDWEAGNKDGVSYKATSITALSNGDLITIVATTSTVKYFVNGVKVATHTTYIPTGALHVGGSVTDVSTAATTARLVSVDLMSLKAY